jgi:predicted PurR-regulated permease PerM
MEPTTVFFETRDVITIVVGVLSLSGLYYTLKRSVDKLANNFVNMQDNHSRDMANLNQSLKETKEDFSKKEQNIYTRIGELREEQKTANERLDIKIDAISSSVNAMNASLAELTGYLKAKKD